MSKEVIKKKSRQQNESWLYVNWDVENNLRTKTKKKISFYLNRRVTTFMQRTLAEAVDSARLRFRPEKENISFQQQINIKWNNIWWKQQTFINLKKKLCYNNKQRNINQSTNFLLFNFWTIEWFIN